MKAWTVERPDEEFSVVVFAETRGKARASGASQDGMYDYIDYGVKRSPEFDKYAEQSYVPISALLENGWWYECLGCRARIIQDCLIDGSAEMIDGYPYCTRCAEKQRTKEGT